MIAVFLHEWQQVRAGANGPLPAMLFLLAVVAIASFAVGTDLLQLARIGPAVVWLAALLASLLAAERMFADDAADGTLDLVRTSGNGVLGYVAAKIGARYLFLALPLVATAPVAGLLVSLAPKAFVGLVTTLAVGSLAVTCLTALGAALSTGRSGASLLGPIVTLPLLVPVVIFGASAAARWGSDAALTPFLLLCATALTTLATVPFATAVLLTERR